METYNPNNKKYLPQDVSANWLINQAIGETFRAGHEPREF